MTTAAELEDEIARDPEDPAPYLVYADWLSERDDPRGELIHVQHALTQTTDEKALRDLRAREQAILDAHLATWMGQDVRGVKIDVHRLDLRTTVTEGLAELLQTPYYRRLRILNLGSYRWLSYSIRVWRRPIPSSHTSTAMRPRSISTSWRFRTSSTSGSPRTG